MKNLPLIINAVLAVLIGILFFLYISLRSQIYKEVPHISTGQTSASNIVYINTDSLYTNFDMYTDMKANMEERQKKMADELALKKSNYEKNVADYQDKMKKGLLLRSEAEKIEQKLMGNQQYLINLNGEMQNQLSDELQRGQKKLIFAIMDFLKEYNKNYNYKYVFSNAFGSNLLYASDSLNITNDVLKGLNEKYNKEVSHKK